MLLPCCCTRLSCGTHRQSHGALHFHCLYITRYGHPKRVSLVSPRPCLSSLHRGPLPWSYCCPPLLWAQSCSPFFEAARTHMMVQPPIIWRGWAGNHYRHHLFPAEMMSGERGRVAAVELMKSDGKDELSLALLLHGAPLYGTKSETSRCTRLTWF